MMKSEHKIFCGKALSIICTFTILLTIIIYPNVSFATEPQPDLTEQSLDTTNLTVENMPQELALLSGISSQQNNMGVAHSYSLTQQNSTAGQVLSTADAADLNGMTIINSDGENTAYVFANNIKYICNNSVNFINNDFMSSNKTIQGKSIAYENIASDKKVYLAAQASDGVVCIDGNISICVKPNTTGENSAQLTTVDINGSQRLAVEYQNVFGANTVLQYLAVYGGMKENLYLNQYTGTNSFSYTLEIPTLSASLLNEGKQVGIYMRQMALCCMYSVSPMQLIHTRLTGRIIRIIPITAVIS